MIKFTNDKQAVEKETLIEKKNIHQNVSEETY